MQWKQKVFPSQMCGMRRKYSSKVKECVLKYSTWVNVHPITGAFVYLKLRESVDGVCLPIQLIYFVQHSQEEHGYSVCGAEPTVIKVPGFSSYINTVSLYGTCRLPRLCSEYIEKKYICACDFPHVNSFHSFSLLGDIGTCCCYGAQAAGTQVGHIRPAVNNLLHAVELRCNLCTRLMYNILSWHCLLSAWLDRMLL